MSEQLQTLSEIAQKTAVPETVLEIFGGLTAADSETDLSDLFSPESAQLFLARVGNVAALLSASDSFEEALAKIDGEIIRLEGLRKDLLNEVYKQVRPLERSYRSLQLFFENADTQQPIDFYVINADASAIKRPGESGAMNAIKEFVRQRNDSFNFRKFISNVVTPGYVSDNTRKSFEEMANEYGMLLIGDVRDHRSFDELNRQFGNQDGALYQSLKRPQDQAASDVIMATWVKLRDSHADFETIERNDDGVYAPSSMLFAGALVRSDRTAGIAQGPVGMKHGKVKGVERPRFETLVKETETLVMERQLVTIIRSADNDLCFMGNRSQAEDPKGLMKFFTTYRIFRLVERMVANYVRQVAGQAIDRQKVDEQVIEPITALFEDLKKAGVILKYDLNHDYNLDEYAQGIVSLDISLLPVGPAERFNIRIRQKRPAAAGANA